MGRVGVVVLHYLVADMTMRCVDLLLARHADDVSRIVVVDNGSPNGSGEELAAHYAGEPRVEVVLAGENLGFARGNNLGYRMLRADDGIGYVAVINNDLLIEQEGFFGVVREIYAQTPFAVLGPDVVSGATGEHQSPSRKAHLPREELLHCREEYQGFLRTGTEPFTKPKGLVRAAASHLPAGVKGALRALAGKPVQQRPLWDSACEDVVLHGACYIFSRDFMDLRADAFNPCTFLYLEEDILHYECQRDGLVIRYDPRLTVMHLEDVATNAAYADAETATVQNGAVINARDAAKRAELCRSIDAFLRIMDEDGRGQS